MGEAGSVILEPISVAPTSTREAGIRTIWSGVAKERIFDRGKYEVWWGCGCSVGVAVCGGSIVDSLLRAWTSSHFYMCARATAISPKFHKSGCCNDFTSKEITRLLALRDSVPEVLSFLSSKVTCSKSTLLVPRQLPALLFGPYARTTQLCNSVLSVRIADSAKPLVTESPANIRSQAS